MGARVAKSSADHRSDIQGLRAIAILSVALYHAGLSALPGGFVGVDIFFVISGYLIAGILLKELQGGRFSIVAFYERRVRRLFPALFTMLAVVLGVGALLLSPNAYDELGHTTFSTIFFVSNFEFLSRTGYFDSDANSRPLLHTWSLAVEEQFYIVFPLLLFALYTFVRKRLRMVLGALGLVSLLASEWLVTRNAPAAFFLPAPRAFELLIGATLAGLALPARVSQGARDALSWLGLALIIASVALYDEATRFPGVNALAPCFGAAAILLAGAERESAAGRVIGNPVFAYVGALSYSLYLWHWPIFVFARLTLLRDPTLLESAALLGLAFVLAAVSWQFIEQPFLKRRGNPRRALATGGALMATGASIAIAIAVLDGVPQRFEPAALAMFAQEAAHNPRRDECHNLLGAVRAYNQNCTFGDPVGGAHWAVWADSEGAELVVPLGARLAEQHDGVVEITASACPPAIGLSRAAQPLCDAQNQATFAGLMNDPRIAVVVLAGDYAGYPRSEWPRIAAGLGDAADSLARAGKRMVLVYPIPTFDVDVPSAAGAIVERGGNLARYAVPRADFERSTHEIYATLDEIAERTDAISFRPAEYLCDQRSCRAFDLSYGLLYFNRNHLSLNGARLLVDHFPLAEAAAISGGSARRVL